jgi:cell division protein FtsZ
MIEFTDENPLRSSEGPASAPSVRIIGIGQTGVSAVDQIVIHGCGSYDLWVMDTDEQTISGSVVTQKMLLGEEMVHGLGCRGDSQLAAQITMENQAQIAKLTADVGCVVVICGLGGATGRAVSSALLKEAQERGVKTIAVVTMPFGFEGEQTRVEAEAALAETRQQADATLVYASDRLVGLSATKAQVRQGFYLQHQTLAHSVETLAQILTREGLIPLSFADIRSLFGRYTDLQPAENCWGASVTVDAEEGPGALIGKLMEHPLLQEEVWKEADRALVCLYGGSRMSLTQVQNIFGQLQKAAPQNYPIQTTTSTEEKMDGKLRLTLLLARTRLPEVATTIMQEEKPARRRSAAQPVKAQDAKLLFGEEDVESAPRGKKSPGINELIVVDKFNRQEELPLEPMHRGRFENSVETIYKGENLDQPTFRRRKIAIRL